ncbi:hypothetical protein HY639_04090 [Candidatus Woesearchaeota archaeon]|nr:hypothetical protein [Candidatus Woesearchaeota archaeon]
METLEKKTGKIITIDGTDRSGKHTQAVLLYERLQTEGYRAALLDFPQYQSFTGEPITAYLNLRKEYLSELGAKIPSVLYAVDRFGAKEQLTRWLAQNTIIVLDRYVESNMAFQSAKLPPEDRASFLQWLERLEHGLLGLPRSDAVVYLHVPPHVTEHLAEQEQRETGKQKDLHEKDWGFQRKVVEQYLLLAAERNWHVIDCVRHDLLLSREQIAEKVWTAVVPCLRT